MVGGKVGYGQLGTASCDGLGRSRTLPPAYLECIPPPAVCGALRGVVEDPREVGRDAVTPPLLPVGSSSWWLDSECPAVYVLSVPWKGSCIFM